MSRATRNTLDRTDNEYAQAYLSEQVVEPLAQQLPDILNPLHPLLLLTHHAQRTRTTHEKRSAGKSPKYPRKVGKLT